jgi:RNA polymerase sigma-70 factor (ECF subfamily)
MMRADLHALEQALAADATLWADGGGKVPHAARRPVHGANAIAVYLSTLVRKFPPALDQTFKVLEVNGWPALVGHSDGAVNVVMTIETDGNTIFALRDVVNPEKLKRLGAHRRDGHSSDLDASPHELPGRSSSERRE